MPGLAVSVEETAATVAALLRERDGAEQKLAASDDERVQAREQARIEAITEQLRLRGQQGAAPVQRAARRGPGRPPNTEQR
jgi:hypothetical protein